MSAWAKKAMRGLGITFTGTSHITWPDRCGESIPQQAVTVTPELKAKWQQIGPQRVTWKRQPIGGTDFRML